MPLAGAAMALWSAAAVAMAVDGADRLPAEPTSPPVMVITVTPARTRLLSGTASEVAVTIQVPGPEADRFKPLRVLATVGSLEMPRPSGTPGRFSARYLPPPDRFPEVALLVIEFGDGPRRAIATARIALEASTNVPFHTSPGAAVTMRVADRQFGPVVADRQGHVDIPIEVPPGIRTGLARVVDHNGAARETEIDLQLPPFPRVVVLAPAVLEVGSFAEIAVLAVDGDGTPTTAADLTLGASDGLVHPLGAGPAGEARFLFEAPRRLGGGAVALTATASGAPPGRTDLAVPLQAGAPARLVLGPSARRLIVGSGDSARILISAHDAFGNRTAATGVQARVDGDARAIAFDPNGFAVVSVAAPSMFVGRDRIDIEASLGGLQATEQIHLTGGVPARLTMEVRQRRVVGDGQQSTELHVQAVDRNGTPTMVPGLSWETPDGRVRRVRVPRDGEYVAEYVPDRTREPHRQTLTVMASHALRADAIVDVIPPPIRVVAAARAGLYSNLGQTVGTAVFLEALRPVEVRRARLQIGITAGYLHGDLSANGLLTTAATQTGPPQIEIDQFPVLLVARGRVALPLRLEIAGEVTAGFSWAAIRILASPIGPAITGSASAPALGLGSQVGLPLKPGLLVLGLRYLWIALGTTSQGDRINGNSAGLIGDIGYKMTF